MNIKNMRFFCCQVYIVINLFLPAKESCLNMHAPARPLVHMRKNMRVCPSNTSPIRGPRTTIGYAPRLTLLSTDATMHVMWFVQ